MRWSGQGVLRGRAGGTVLRPSALCHGVRLPQTTPRHPHASVFPTPTLRSHLAVLLGPKLYEANWRDLTRAGYLANVQVTEVWCPMTPAFYREYLRAPAAATRSALAVMNPVKCWAMDRLLRVHEARGDKIIVFSESVFALKLYAQRYGSLAICGDTPMLDRCERRARRGAV